VKEHKSLELVEEMILADLPFTAGVTPPRWNSSTIPLFLRLYNLILVGSASYFLVLTQRSISIRANKILIFFVRSVILRSKNFA
jgi:hypothetical protein